MKKRKSIFTEGPISAFFIAESIAAHQSKTTIGAHEIFLGQVREDESESGKVTAIEYSAYEDMAEDIAYEIREEAFSKFPLVCLHIYHSLGMVKAGEISLFVFASSAHREGARHAVARIVDRIKSELPIFGKELLESGKVMWKSNSKGK